MKKDNLLKMITLNEKEAATRPDIFTSPLLDLTVFNVFSVQRNVGEF